MKKQKVFKLIPIFLVLIMVCTVGIGSGFATDVSNQTNELATPNELNLNLGSLENTTYPKSDNLADSNSQISVDSNKPTEDISSSFDDDSMSYADSVSEDQLDNQVVYVNDSYTGSVSDGTLDNPYKNVNSALSAMANEKGNVTIYVAGGNYTGTQNTGLTIKNNSAVLTISAFNNEEVIFDAESSRQIFDIAKYVNLNLIGLTFANGKTNSPKYGGAIAIGNKACVMIESCNFINNYNNQRGGAIYCDGANLTIFNSKFLDNTCPTGGAILDRANSNVTINNCEFKDNYASSNAGAINNFNSNLIVNNSNFISNSAKSEAGAIRCDAGYLEVYNSNFIDNTVESNGGAITDNAGSSIKIDNCLFENNTAKISGGAIYSRSAPLEITNTNFKNNTVIGSGNYEIGGGAAIRSDNSNLAIDNCNFEGNIINRGTGGAIASNDYSNLTINNSKFIENRADNNDNSNCAGGAIYLKYNTINNIINNTIFESNFATAYGGAIRSYAELTIYNSVFRNNGVNGYGSYTGGYSRGGAINIAEATLTAYNCQFVDNYAADGGGAIRLNGSSVINNCLFEGNYLLNNKYTYGSAIYNNIGQDTIIENSVFKDNTAIQGTIYNNGNGKFTIKNSIFANNTANDAAAIYNEKGTIDVNNVTFVDNKATNRGGVIYNNKGTLIITNSNIYNNVAEFGGFLFTDGNANNYVSLNRIYNNHAEFGQDVYFSSKMNVVSYFDDNWWGINDPMNNNWDDRFVCTDYVLNSWMNMDVTSSNYVRGNVVYVNVTLKSQTGAILNFALPVKFNVSLDNEEIILIEDGTINSSFNEPLNYQFIVELDDQKWTYNRIIYSNITCDNIGTLYEDDDVIIKGNLVDDLNNVIANADVNISIFNSNGIINSVIVQTDENGAYYYNFGTLSQGNYSIAVIYQGDEIYQSANVDSTFNVIVYTPIPDPDPTPVDPGNTTTNTTTPTNNTNVTNSTTDITNNTEENNTPTNNTTNNTEQAPVTPVTPTNPDVNVNFPTLPDTNLAPADRPKDEEEDEDDDNTSDDVTSDNSSSSNQNNDANDSSSATNSDTTSTPDSNASTNVNNGVTVNNGSNLANVNNAAANSTAVSSTNGLTNTNTTNSNGNNIVLQNNGDSPLSLDYPVISELAKDNSVASLLISLGSIAGLTEIKRREKK